MDLSRRLTLIFALFVVTTVISMPKELPIKFSGLGKDVSFVLRRPYIDTDIMGKRVQVNFDLKQGLDLQGGSHVVLEADMSNVKPEDRKDALESVKTVLTRRVDMFGVSEPVVQTSINNDQYRIIIEMPGLKDMNQALTLIGTTAQLDFRELAPTATTAATMADFVPSGLSGKDLQKASVGFGQAGQPEVQLVFTNDGSLKFGEVTGRNIGRPVGIFLDGIPVTTPVVNSQITGGNAVITGSFTVEEAKNLAIQLNAGALPVGVKIIEQRNVGATLGKIHVEKSIVAGTVGLGLVMLFMILLYGVKGLVADLALILYGLITLTLYKLIPVTVTLPGLAGFMLSVGMAVDSNILIFERIKEETRMGKSMKDALELGFGRAWDSIKDANAATLITAFILFNPLDWKFLNSSGMVRGFALTLGIGVAVSLFTGIVVSRNLLRAWYQLTNKQTRK